ncbi:MAG: hypothetical protein ABTQ32_28845 [Myxococcaceae bacterium]
MFQRALPVLLVLLVGCKREAVVKDIAVADAAAQFRAKTATPVDANTPEYREGAGWVPGAVLLDDYLEYPLTVLPADHDRPLVFYCTSRM